MTRVITKDNCAYCVRAKALLDMHDIEYDEFKLGEDVTLEEFTELTNGAKTVPQIWLTYAGSDIFIGGYDKLADHFNRA
jgi:thioredoxin reductase (NADPH)